MFLEPEIKTGMNMLQIPKFASFTNNVEESGKDTEGRG
jgi:hypothetical protein